VPVLFHRPPPRVLLTLDGQKHFIPMPPVAGPGSELSGIRLAIRAASLTNGLVSYDDSTFQQHLFLITSAQAEAKIPPHGVANNFPRETVVLIASSWVYGAHAATLSYRLRVEQVLDASIRAHTGMKCISRGTFSTDSPMRVFSHTPACQPGACISRGEDRPSPGNIRTRTNACRVTNSVSRESKVTGSFTKPRRHTR
jgi:hypothetical protein